MYPKVRMRVKYILFYVWLLCLTNCAEVNKDFSTPEWTTGAEITAALMETSILVEWPAVDVDDLKEYHVYIEDEVIAVVDGEQLSYRLENLTPAQEYIIAIRARDQAGNFSVAPLRARVRTTDDTPPIWEEPSLTASIIDDSSVLLSWSGARDNVSVSGYLLYRDGILTQRLTTDQESYTWTSLNPGQSYTVTIQSIDGEGLQSSDGPSTTFTLPDQQAPTWPEEGSISVVEQTDTTLSLLWDEAIDEGQVRSYLLSIDGGERDDIPGNDIQLDVPMVTLTELSPGATYEVSVRAVDDAGNQSAALTLQVMTTDTVSPSWTDEAFIEILSVQDDSIDIGWSRAEDQGHIAGYIVMRDLRDVARVDGDTLTTRVDGLRSDTSYDLEVYAIDFNGNRSDRPLTVTARTSDSLSPEWPAGAILSIAQLGSGRVQASWPAALDNVAVTNYSISVDGASALLLDGRLTFQTLVDLNPQRSYTVTVIAQDRVGRSSEPLMAEFTAVDDVHPQWDNEAQVNVSAISESELSLSWTPATDNVGLSHYQIELEGVPSIQVTSIESQHTVTGLNPWTSYRVRVFAIDHAENRSLQPLVGIARTLDTTPPSYTSPSPLFAESIEARSCLLVWESAEDNVAVIGYEIRHNGESVYEGDQRHNRAMISDLQPGQRYIFELVAIDIAGLMSEPVTIEVLTSDSGPPMWPSDARLSVVSRRGQDLALTWTCGCRRRGRCGVLALSSECAHRASRLCDPSF